MKHVPSACLALAAAVSYCAADDPRGDHPDAPPSTAQEELARFHVPPGFEVQLVAAEPDIQKPINLNFDGAGRLWVTGSELYPWPASTDANGQPIPDFDKGFQGIMDSFHVKGPEPAKEGRDSVRILSDFDASGRAREITVFADHLSIPSGVQPLFRDAAVISEAYGMGPRFDPNPAMVKLDPLNSRHLGRSPKGDSAIVYSIPTIWLITDWDGDGFAESRIPLYTGFGYTDTHGGSSSYTYWIDGWIYGTHGFRNRSQVRDRLGRVTPVESGNTYRFRPDGSAFEIFAHGQTNPFGLAFDGSGNLFSADSHSKPVYLLLHGGWYEGIGKQHDGLGFAPRITEDDHGSSAIGGIACYTDDQWPEEYRGNLFNGNPVTQKINRDKLEWHGSSPRAIRQPDFLTCDDPWFRPVNLRLGPDGALYIADFYNPIIGHYEVPLNHPARDHTHGRIWRVVWRGLPGVGEPAASTSPEGETRKPRTVPDLTKLDAAGLAGQLNSPSLEIRRMAVQELTDRVGKNALPALNSTRIQPVGRAFLEEVVARIRSQGSVPPSNDAAGDADQASQVLILRQVAERPAWNEAEQARALRASDSDAPLVRRIQMEALGLHPSADHLAPLLKVWKEAPTDDPELVYTVRLALKNQLLAPNNAEEFRLAGRWQADLLTGDAPPFLRAAIYARADELAESDADAGEKLADVCLAVPSPESADYLLRQLRRTKLATARAGEYLKHAALHLPAERFKEVVDLAGQLGGAPLAQRFAVAEGLGAASRQRRLPVPDSAADWMRAVIIEALATEDEGIQERAIAAARDLKSEEKLAPLQRIVLDAKAKAARRASALEAAANLKEASKLEEAALADPSSLTLRKKAVELLAQSRSGEAMATLLDTLASAPGELAPTIAAELAKIDWACDFLLHWIEHGRAAPSLLRHRLVAANLEKRSPEQKERAAALTKDLPPEDERLDAVIGQRLDAFRNAKPDAVHGAQVFKQNCMVCHRFRSVGGNIGPNLDGVSARGPHRLIEDILDPNRNVDPGFRQTTIETTDGRSVVGANLREQPDLVRVTTAAGEEAAIPRAEIRSMSTSRLSLMPPIFETQIPPADFNDLLAYLLSPPPAP